MFGTRMYGRQLFAKHQRGIAAVEFAIIGSIVMVLLFAVFEFARAFFVYNMLEETTRRGARLAAVCPVNDPAVRQIAVFNTSGGGSASPLVYGLTTGNVEITYVNDAGAVIGDPITDYDSIAYVRARIVGFQHQLLIPMFMRTFAMPSFVTTVPRESLGVSKDGVTPC
jgi:Flp pilus assembly protein TadG